MAIKRESGDRDIKGDGEPQGGKETEKERKRRERDERGIDLAV